MRHLPVRVLLYLCRCFRLRRRRRDSEFVSSVDEASKNFAAPCRGQYDTYCKSPLRIARRIWAIASRRLVAESGGVRAILSCEGVLNERDCFIRLHGANCVESFGIWEAEIVPAPNGSASEIRSTPR